MIPGLSRVPKVLRGTLDPVHVGGNSHEPELALLVTVNPDRYLDLGVRLEARARWVAYVPGFQVIRNLTGSSHPLHWFEVHGVAVPPNSSTDRDNAWQASDWHIELDSWSMLGNSEAALRMARAWRAIEDRVEKCREVIGAPRSFADVCVRLLLATGVESAVVLASGHPTPWRRDGSYDQEAWRSVTPAALSQVLGAWGDQWEQAGRPE